MNRVVKSICGAALASVVALSGSTASAGLFGGCGLLSRLHKSDCCEPAPVCCEAPAPSCCEAAPAPCCEPAPAPCCEAPAPTCCEAPAPSCCEADPCCAPKKRCGLFSRLHGMLHRNKGACCEAPAPSCCEAAPACSSCEAAPACSSCGGEVIGEPTPVEMAPSASDAPPAAPAGEA